MKKIILLLICLSAFTAFNSDAGIVEELQAVIAKRLDLCSICDDSFETSTEPSPPAGWADNDGDSNWDYGTAKCGSQAVYMPAGAVIARDGNWTDYTSYIWYWYYNYGHAARENFAQARTSGGGDIGKVAISVDEYLICDPYDITDYTEDTATTYALPVDDWSLVGFRFIGANPAQVTAWVYSSGSWHQVCDAQGDNRTYETDNYLIINNVGPEAQIIDCFGRNTTGLPYQ